MSQTAVHAFLLAHRPEDGLYSGVGRSLMDEIAGEYWADRKSSLAEAYRASAHRGARWGHLFTRYLDAAGALPLLETRLGLKVAVVGVSSAYITSVLPRMEESIEMVLLGHDVVSVGEWSLLEELIRANLTRELRRDCGLALNRAGLLDTGGADAVRSVEQLYRAAAAQNRVEPIWDSEVGIVESVAVLVEPRFVPSRQT